MKKLIRKSFLRKLVLFPNNNAIKSNFHFAPEFSENHSVPLSWIGNGEEWTKVDFKIDGVFFINFNFGVEVGYYY